MKRISLFVGLLFLSLVVAQAQTNAPAPAKDTKTEQEVKAAQLAVKEAAKAKDRAAYERLIAEGFTFIHSNGATETRKSYIDRATAGALTIQQEGADVEVQDQQMRIYEDRTAVLIARGVLRSPGQKAELALRTVSVYVKLDGRWQWAFGQSSPLPARPAAAAIDHRLYDAYVGEYEIGPGRTFSVTRDGETLRGQSTNRQPGELIPKSETEFIWFNPDMIIDAQVIFIKDEAGHVTHVAFRNNGQEAWRAKKMPR
jgi:uncharacterized protein (TIGR02246 family)